MTHSWNGHEGCVRDHIGEYRVIDCTVCGFSHIVPLPTGDELEEVYGEEYYTKEKPLFIIRQQEDLDWWRLVFDDRYDFFEQQLPVARRQILDIGCGPGFFLQRGAERGWSGCGVEPSRQAAEHARSIGVEVINASLEKAGLEEGGSFDVVHMSEVLEHVSDPLSFCRRAAALLKPGGVLCAVVPNDYNPLQEYLRREYGHNPYWVAPPHHLNYFSSDSLQKLLLGSGLSILKRSAMFPMEFFLAVGTNYVGNDEIGRRCHAKRKRFDIALASSGLQAFRREMYEMMARHDIGREVIIFATK